MFRQLLFNLTNRSPAFIRKVIYKIIGLKQVEFRKNVSIDSLKNVIFGRNVFVNHGVDMYTSGGQIFTLVIM